jgi:superfamily II DNA or RNA helicase
MNSPTDRKILDYLVDESSVAFVKRGVSMANRKFVISLEPCESGARIKFVVRSGSGAGAYSGVVSEDGAGGLAASCQCPASSGFLVCKHVVAAIVVDWRERGMDSFVVAAMASTSSIARIEKPKSKKPAPKPRPVKSSRSKEQWQTDMEHAGWGRILDRRLSALSGPVYSMHFGLHMSTMYMLSRCDLPLMEFALHPENPALSPSTAGRLHEWIKDAVENPRVIGALCDAETAERIPDTELQEFVYGLQERIAVQPTPLARELFNAVQVTLDNEEPVIRIEALPVPFFEDTRVKPVVTIRVLRGAISEVDVKGLERAASPALATSLACNVVLARLLDDLSFLNRCVEFLARDPWEKYHRAWRGFAPAAPESVAASIPAQSDVVVGYRVTRKDSALYRGLDVVMPKIKAGTRGRPATQSWVLAPPDWLRGELGRLDSRLSMADRRILESIRIREKNDIATKKFTIAKVTGDNLAWLVGHPYVVDDAGKPLAVRRGEPVLSVRPAGKGEVEIGLTVGGIPLGEVETPDRFRGYCEASSSLVAWDAKNDTLWVSDADSVILRLKNDAGRMLGRVSQSVLDDMLPSLPWLSEHMAIDVADELKQAVIRRPLVPRLRVRKHLEGIRFEVVCRAPGYRTALHPAEGPSTVYVSAESGVEVIARDKERERVDGRALVEQLGLARLREEPPWVFDADSFDEASRILEAVQAESVSVEWVDSEPIRLSWARMEGTQLRVGRRRDWFELEGSVDTGTGVVDLQELLAAIRDDRRAILVDGDRLVLLDEKLREAFGMLAVSSRGGNPRVTPAHSSMLEELQAEGAEIDVPEVFSASADALKASRTADIQLPADLRAELRPYQEEGYRWLCRMAMWAPGACLADDMGLGKTMQTLGFLLVRASGGPALVVTPTSLTYNWLLEAERFAPTLKVARWDSRSPLDVAELAVAGAVVVVSYDMLANNLERFQGVRWSSVVLDEAHAIKNPSTKRAKAVVALEAEFRLALTGTPMENRTSELWGLFRFIAPGLLGSLSDFTAMFARPIEQYGDDRTREVLGGLVRPFLLRRLKSEVAQELPEKVERNIYVDMEAAEQRIYDELRESTVKELTKGRSRDGSAPQTRILVLAALTRMRQAACHGRLVSTDAPAEASKQAVLNELLDELVAEGGRVLVFSQFPSVFPFLAAGFAERGLRFEYLDGSTAAARRQALVASFEAGEFPVFLLSLKAGGTGLNLTAADTVIHLDPWWNPAVEDQATDRAHRIGQTRRVQVIRLISRGTVEEGILALHGEKRALTDAMLDGTDRAGVLSTAELMALLQAAPGGIDARG